VGSSGQKDVQPSSFLSAGPEDAEELGAVEAINPLRSTPRFQSLLRRMNFPE
jgi:hypothetical protein